MARTHPDPSHGPDCYSCRLSSVRAAFGSVGGVLQGPDGRKNFHGQTIAEKRAEAIREAKIAGNEPVQLTRREREAFRS